MNTYIITFTYHSLLFGAMKSTMRIEAPNAESAERHAVHLTNELGKAVAIPISYKVRKSRK